MKKIKEMYAVWVANQKEKQKKELVSQLEKLGVDVYFDTELNFAFPQPIAKKVVMGWVGKVVAVARPGSPDGVMTYRYVWQMDGRPSLVCGRVAGGPCTFYKEGNNRKVSFQSFWWDKINYGNYQRELEKIFAN